MAKRKKTSASKGKKKAKKRGGSWTEGQSGNPRGRPPDKELRELREQAKELFGPFTDEACAKIVELMRGASDKVQLAASQEIINRVYGKVPDKVNIGDADGGKITGDKEAILGFLFGIKNRGATDRETG